MFTDYERIKELDDKAKEYERQRDEIWSCFLQIEEEENKKYTFQLMAGIREDLKITLSNEQAEFLVKDICQWYKSKVIEINKEISKCLTDEG